MPGASGDSANRKLKSDDDDDDDDEEEEEEEEEEWVNLLEDDIF